MKRLSALILVPVLLVCFGCATTYQTPHPAIETGIYLTQLQMDLQAQYIELYPFLSESEQEFMRDEIAPMINNMKYRVNLYNEAVLVGERPQYTEAEIRMLARQISFKLLEVQK